jgi:hypothetical protein
VLWLGQHTWRQRAGCACVCVCVCVCAPLRSVLRRTDGVVWICVQVRLDGGRRHGRRQHTHARRAGAATGAVRRRPASAAGQEK